MEDLLWLLIVGYLFFGDALRKWWRREQEKSRERRKAETKPVPAQWEPSVDEEVFIEHAEPVAPPVRARSPLKRAAATEVAPTLSARLAQSAPSVPSVPSVPSAQRFRAQPPLEQLGLDDPRALRRAIVLMTVLGPCRANEVPRARGERGDLSP